MSDEFDKRRAQLHDLNSEAWEEKEVFKILKLDSSFKKNTAYIKKIRTSINKENEKSLVQGIATTSLEKYLSELTSAVAEGLTGISKSSDIYPSIEVVSALHQRFNVKFTPFLLCFFTHALSNPSKPISMKDWVDNKEEQQRLSRQRLLLRLLMEFFLSGIFRSPNDMPNTEMPSYVVKRLNKNPNENLILLVLKEILSFSIESGSSLQLASGFLKRFQPYLFESTKTKFIRDDVRLAILECFKVYTKAVVNLTESLYKAAHKKTDKAQIISMKIGKLVEGLEDEIVDLKARFELFNNYCETVCDTLDIPKPSLKIEVEVETSKVTVVAQSKSDYATSCWENDEIRRFYEDIPNISAQIERSREKENELASSDSHDADESAGSKMTQVLFQIDEALTDKELEEAVYKYWEYGLNNKSSKARIYRHFIDTKSTRPLRNFAKFLKINEEEFEQVKNDLIAYLDKGFRSQIHNDKIDFKNVHFFCELIKFKMVPTYVIFHKIRSLILNIQVANNIDILTLMFEDCGKLLLNDVEYKQHTKEMIDLLKETRKNANVNSNDKSAIKVFLINLTPVSVKQLNKNNKNGLE
ncbi:unnamed protein product [[Candida] boidinii]|nr:unnamed protein product [[Candida] boidinii]